MAASVKGSAWRLGIVVAVVLILGGGLYAATLKESEAFPSMPSDEQDYWAWVTTINRGSEVALDAGVRLLEEHPHIQRLYVRLAELCIDEGAVQVCRDAFDANVPPTPLTRLYRDAARAMLVEHQSPDSARALWRYLAGTDELDPSIARMIVDVSRADASADWSDSLAAQWEAVLRENPGQAGASFGLGYLAVLNGDWDGGETYLAQTALHLPDDPEAYRELGRIYYTTGRPDDFESTLTRGIEAARRRHEVEKELILRGNLGLGAMQRGQFEMAKESFHAALAASRALSDGETEGFNLFRIAGIVGAENKFDEALDLIDRSIYLFEAHAPGRLSEVLVRKAYLNRSLFRFSDAETALQTAAEQARYWKNAEAELTATLELGNLRYEVGQYTAAREIAREVLQRAQEYGYVMTEMSAWLLLGDIAHMEGIFERAREYYGQALNLAEEGRLLFSKALILNRLGHAALNVQDANAANEHFNELLELAEYQEDSTALASVFRGLGKAYRQYGNYGQSIKYHNLGLSYVPEHLPLQRAYILIGKSWTYLYSDSLVQARSTLEEAKPVALTDPTCLYNYYLTEGHILLQSEEYRQALASFDRALQMHPQVPSTLNWHIYYAKALAQWRMGEAKLAEISFQRAVAAVETTRDRLSSGDLRSTYVHDKAQVFKDYAAFLEDQGRWDEALHFTERSRSRSLVDLLYSGQRERDRDLSQPLDQALDMAQRISALVEEERQFYEEGALLASTEEVMRVARLREERLVLESAQARLELGQRHTLYTFDPISASAAQRVLKDSEALVVFNLRTRWSPSKEEDASVVYVVLPNRIIVRPLDIDQSDLFEAIKFFRSSISSDNAGPGDGWQPVARRLYRELIEPVSAVLPEGVTHLHLVPEGVLHYLPFASLLNDNEFLVERYTLSVVPSATVLSLCRRVNPGQWRSVALFGDPDGVLPGSRREVTQIAEGDPKNRKAWVGSDANVARVAERANQYDILHFATHGRFFARAPWRSHLEMHGEPLTLSSIADLDLRSSYLVTLSACETGLAGGYVSDVPKGEEWVGLNQAFLAAGAPTVMASLWPIDDRVSAEFMKVFYDNLVHSGKAEALANVQREFLKYPEKRHPFYWAAFTVVGDPL